MDGRRGPAVQPDAVGGIRSLFARPRRRAGHWSVDADGGRRAGGHGRDSPAGVRDHRSAWSGNGKARRRTSMFRTIDDFEKAWANESESSLKVMRALTDASLGAAGRARRPHAGPDRVAHRADARRDGRPRGPEGRGRQRAHAAAGVGGSDRRRLRRQRRGRGEGGEGGLEGRRPRRRDRDVRREVAARQGAAGADRARGAPPRPDDGAHAPGGLRGARRLRPGEGRVGGLRDAGG